MCQTAWISMYKLLSNLKKTQPLSLLLLPLNVSFSDTIIPDSGKKKKKKFVTSDQTSKQRIYITFYICRKCLKKNPSKSKCIPQKEIAEASCISLQFSSTHCQHQHHILAELCFSYSYAVPFEVTLGKPVWYQSPPYTLVIWIWMFFLPCLSLEKQLQNLYQVISLECKERDIINPLFHLFRNWGEHHNIQVVE